MPNPYATLIDEAEGLDKIEELQVRMQGGGGVLQAGKEGTALLEGRGGCCQNHLQLDVNPHSHPSLQQFSC